MAGDWRRSGGRPPRARPLPLPRRRGRRRGTGRRGGRRPNKNNTCFNCGEAGHHAARCRRPVRYRRCRQEGHRSDACPRSSPRPDASRLNRPAERQVPVITTLGAKKRPRESDSTTTGYMRETKRATTTTGSKFLYAQTAQGATSLVVFHQDRRPVTGLGAGENSKTSTTRRWWRRR